MKRYFLKKQKGETMVELLIAISIVVVSLLGMFALINRALGLNRINSEQYIATYLASEGIEVMKNIFDRGFFEEDPGSGKFYSADYFDSLSGGVYQVDFKSTEPAAIGCSFPSNGPTEAAVRALFQSCGASDPIRFDTGSGAYGYELVGSDIIDTKFRRFILVDAPAEYGLDAPLEFRVTSAVGWESRGGSFVVHLQDHFLPWRIP